MSNKNIKKMFLFLTLLVLFIGVISAHEVSSDSSTEEITIEKISDNNKGNIENKNIAKKDSTDKIKTGTSSNSTNNINTTPKAYKTTAKTYTELVNKISQAKKSDYTSYTINLQKGTYKATQKLDWDNTKLTSQLIINGNAAVIDGLNKYQFLEIGEGYTVTLKNLTIKNFNGENGGAINNEGTLTITNTKLTNNNATKNGGAIYTSGKLSITKSQINFNTAGKNGGAIYLDQTEDCIINRNTFTANMAGEDGGAIYVYDSYATNINYNNFTKNTAQNDGGAIANTPRSESYTYSAQEPYLVQESYLEQYWNPTKNYGIIGYTTTYNYNPMGYSTPIQIPRYGYTGGYDYKTVTRYVTKYRTVTRTGYHYYGSDTTIQGNNFIQNTANDEAAAILISHGNVNITKNKFQKNKDNITTKSIENNGENYNKNIYQYSKNGNPIKDYGNTNINSNTFDDRLTTKLTVNDISTIYYGQKLSITGNLLNNNNPVKNQNITITLNDKEYTAKTSTTGNFEIKIAAKTVGSNNLTINYAGNNAYTPIDYKTQVNVTKSPTKITINKITQRTYNDQVTITGKFTNALGTPFKNIKVTINVNAKNYITKTDDNGIYTLTIKANKVGINNITVSQNGGKNYNPTTTKTTFKTIQRPTNITINKIATTKGKTVKITGKLTDNTGKAYQNIKVKITVNNKNVLVKTDSNGIYTYNYNTTTKGTFTVTASYAGNTNYKPTSTKTTLSVA